MKADGYGLGAAQVGRALCDAGCEAFFVATADEAGALRAALGERPAIYVLNGAAEGLAAIVAAGARPVLNTLDEAREGDAFGRARGAPLRAALQLETGMNRLGAEAEAVAAAGRLDGLRVDLILSHLACADTPERPENAAQKARFDAGAALLRPLFPQARLSLAATGGALMGSGFAYDMTRPGIGIFGAAPYRDGRPTVRLEAPLLRVFEVPDGAASGYGGTWVAQGRRTLATLAVGYADGFPRRLSNRGEARVGGVAAPFAGRVSMDLIVIDVTEASRRGPVRVGAPAALIDETLTVDRIATAADTIGYEILTRLGPRFDRVYRDAPNEG